MPTVHKQQRRSFRSITILVLGVGAALRLLDLSSVPYGWHPDEATKALLARDVLAGKYFPAFFSAFTGREALYVYLEAGFFSLLGERIFSARLLSAFIGVLTVALTYTVARRLFNRRVSLFAAVFMATSLWHLIASRNGYRAVLQPLVQIPVLLLLFSALRAQGRYALRAWFGAGLWLGLTQYTYTAARFFPFVVAAVLGIAALQRPAAIWARRRGWLLLILAAFLVFLPLGIHFIQNPADFYGRASQISVFSEEWSGGEPWPRLWQSVRETARMFTVWGDINYRFNIAGRPVFGPVTGALFYLGLVVCAWRLVRARAGQRLAYAALFLWMGIMLLPMTLSAESLPYYQRAIGILPAVYIFPALTLDAVAAAWHKIPTSSPAPAASVPLLALLSLGLLTANSYGDYFDEWHDAPRNDDDRRVAMFYLAEYLQQAGAPGPLYLSTQYVQHPTLALLAPDHYDRVNWFDATQSLPLPAEGESASYLMLLENAPQPLLLEALPHFESLNTGYDRFGRPVFETYRWFGDRWPDPQDTSPPRWSWATSFVRGASDDWANEISLPVNFGDVLNFQGHNRAPEGVLPGERLELVLFWEILQRPSRPYTFFVHLLDHDSRVVAGYDANTYATAFWPENGGEMLLNYFPLSLSADLAPGEYQVEVGVYHQPSGERLPVLLDGELVADRLLLAPVIIP